MPPDLQPEAPATPEPAADAVHARHQRLLAAYAAHWLSTRRLTALLLALWLATSFGTVFFARELAQLSVSGWPLSFYMAAQGASLVYLAIIGGYAWRMRRIDRAAARLAAEAA
jgi:putative solute:sodium symporter small subunit